MLEVVLGMVVVFLVLSVIASALNEAWATWSAARGRILAEAIKRLLGTERSKQFYAHPRIAALCGSDATIESAWLLRRLRRFLFGTTQLDDLRNPPSYVEGPVFAATVLDLVAPRPSTDPATHLVHVGAAADRLASEAAGRRDVAPLDAVLAGFVRDAVAKAPPQRDGGIEALHELQTAIASWYGATMDRTTGWYRRRSQRSLLVIACGLVFPLNVDSLRVAAELYRQPTLRANLAAMGETLAQREGVADAGTAATAKELLSQLAQVPGLPIGWASFWPSEPTLTPSPGSMPGESVTGSLFAAEARTLQKWLGLLLSVVATSLGAPFWFQLLNRIVSLRGNGKAAVAAVVDQDRDAAAGKDAVLPVATRSASAGEPVPTAVATRRTAKIDDAYWEHARHTPRRPLATGSQLAGIAGSDLGLALDVARLAKLVYRDLADASTIATSLGWQEVRAFSEAGTQAMALSRDDLVVVVYRGTEPSALEDLITDAKFRLRPATELVAAARGRVHRGFLQALQHVLPQLEALLAQPPFAGKPVVCTGHSLGGALATLHARVRLASTPANLRAAQPLVTFGSPRVGDAAFCAELQGLLGHGGGLRFVHGRDLVTRVPTRVQDYDHVGRVCYFDDAGRLQPDGAEWFRWLADVIDATQDFRAASKRTVADHDCDHYVMALEAILPLVR